MRERKFWLLPIILVLVAFSFSTLKIYGLNTIEIFSPTDKPYGLSYEEHATNFWKWLLSIPIDQNPEPDLNGERCTISQQNSNSSVFYLSGSGSGKVERTCEIPSGKGILMPVMVVEVSDEEVPNASIDELSKIAKNDQDGVTTLYLKIDDKEYQIKELSKYRIHTDAFTVNFPKNAMFGASEGPSKAVADGHYIISKPLSKGEHTILWKSSLLCPEIDCLEVNFAQEVKYNIIVK